MTFENKIKSILKEIDEDYYSSIDQIIEEWSDIVEASEGGYCYSLYEYLGELHVRYVIEKLLTSQQLDNYEEYTSFKSKILLLDERFKANFIELKLPNRNYWWEKGLPKAGGEQFVENVYSEYGVKLDRA